MKTKFILYTLGLFLLLNITACSKQDDLTPSNNNKFVESPDGVESSNQISGTIIPEKDLIQATHQLYKDKYRSSKKLKYDFITHKSMTYICAKKLNLSEERAIIMRDASIMPDFYQAGIENGYNQQWSHAFMLKKTIFGTSWVWGDADDDFHDNLDGDSGEVESPEGYNGKWAGHYYKKGERDLGDWYVGYACHFMEDIGFVLHTSFPNIAMLAHHLDFEVWMDNNWNQGYRFIDDASSISPSDYHYIEKPKQAINQAAKASNWYYSKYGKKAWEAYQASGYPTKAGTGNQELVDYTRSMIKETTKWTGGTIQYALNKYKQW